jgi:hypothetical protein
VGPVVQDEGRCGGGESAVPQPVRAVARHRAPEPNLAAHRLCGRVSSDGEPLEAGLRVTRDGRAEIREREGEQQRQRAEGHPAVPPEPPRAERDEADEKQGHEELRDAVAVGRDRKGCCGDEQKARPSLGHDHQPHRQGDEKGKADGLEGDPRELQVPGRHCQ